MSGWIGVDLDGTLAEYTEWKGPLHIGKPIPKMVRRVKKWVAEGKDVRIFTARIAVEGFTQAWYEAVNAIHRWCNKHLGFELTITCKKDFEMIELWDDRAVQVIPNTGERADRRGRRKTK